MSNPAAPKKSTARDFKWWAIGGAALIIAAGSFIAVVSSTKPATVVLASAHSIPTRLTIPSIGVDTVVGVLGLQPDGQVMVPATTSTVGWYRYGPTPGALGSSVILGHVDSYRGPGVFFYLRTLKTGALIHVHPADGLTATFVVVGVVQYSKSTFPDQLVYGPHGRSLLNLVTCGGVFDHATGHYQSNIVVFSQLLRTSKPRSA